MVAPERKGRLGFPVDRYASKSLNARYTARDHADRSASIPNRWHIPYATSLQSRRPTESACGDIWSLAFPRMPGSASTTCLP